MSKIFRILFIASWAFLFSTIHAEKKKCDFQELDTKLVSGFATPAVHSILPSISENGDQSYLFFVNFNYSYARGTQPVAQLFNNVNGKLKVGKTLPFDPKLPIAYAGFASKDFSKFSVIEGNEVAKMQIKLLDTNFNVIASRLFIDPKFQFVIGGTFSENGRYLLFGYDVGAPHGVNTFVYILDATKPDLPTVAGPITIKGADEFQGGPMLFFTLVDSTGRENLFFTFMNHQVTKFNIAPPYFSQVYKVNVDTGVISLVDEKPLPKFAENTVFVLKNRKKALICLGGQCSVNPKQPNIYTIVGKNDKCDLPGNCQAIRVFTFDGKKQKLLFKQPSNCCSFLTVYPPSNGTLYFLGQAISNFTKAGDPASRAPNPQEFWSLFRLKRGPSGLTLRPLNGPFQDTKSTSTVFSNDGKWMLRTGAYGYAHKEPHLDNFGIRNVLLFKVSSAEYKPVCKLK